MAATRYKLDDFAPYLFKTGDYGATWTRITGGLPDHVFTPRHSRGSRRDAGCCTPAPRRACTCRSTTAPPGSRCKGNLPVVPIHDLVVKEPEGDLVVATHGRSFWILDDLGPVRAPFVRTSRRGAGQAATGRAGTWSTSGFGHKADARQELPHARRDDGHLPPEGGPAHGRQDRPVPGRGRNPPDGAIIHYFLGEEPDSDISLTFLGGDGNEIRTFSSRDLEAAATSRC